MSAFIHHPAHIITIVASASALLIGPLVVDKKTYNLSNADDCQQLCRILQLANVRSVNSRYSQRKRREVLNYLPHNGGPDYLSVTHLNAAALCKAIDSLEYQSCERSDYQKSAACSLLIQLRLRANIKAVGLFRQAEDTAAYQSADVWSIAQ